MRLATRPLTVFATVAARLRAAASGSGPPNVARRAAPASPWPLVSGRVRPVVLRRSTRESLGRAQPAARATEGVRTGEEALQQPVRALGALHLGHVPAVLEQDLLRPRQPALHVALEPCR